ncbi:PQQ-dependent sugar dehydrogenase [Solimonas terrae]|uniref:Sorbosone dehydrogenase family protein n=1 Tax=Solimonas terrae TaxID=1396819 RepID=A0A6M2BPD2_9GAMM|nr:sorbosone dehydrogenase family protein [Solimonas terrae]NGY03893.1 sorbosone dehydrogenase family protein [Solimonas terrae]
MSWPRRSALLLIVTLAACGNTARLTVEEGSGPQPKLPPADRSVIPTVDVAQAIGWPDGGKPVAPRGLEVAAFASGLGHPRWLYVLPNGDVLVAETHAPAQPDDGSGIKARVTKWVMRRAGAIGDGDSRITLLRDRDGDGIVDRRTVFIDNLDAPLGMAMVGSTLYVADTDAVLAFPYRDGETRISAAPRALVELPAGRINHHWTRNLIASADGRKLYVTVGSNSNIAENGMAAEAGRAAIWEVDVASGAHRVFATGLRNPNGMAWEPVSGKLWVAVNERDGLGSDLVPDYMTSVQDGGFYGWPYSYFGRHVDARVQPQRPDLVAEAIVPDYALGPHTASLGLCAAQGNSLPAMYGQGMFVGQHGSWNRRPRSGYKVIFVPFRDGMPNGAPIDVLGGFLSGAGQAHGRPVGVAIDNSGALLVADDVGNTVWRVTAAH